MVGLADPAFWLVASIPANAISESSLDYSAAARRITIRCLPHRRLQLARCGCTFIDLTLLGRRAISSRGYTPFMASHRSPLRATIGGARQADCVTG